MNRTEDICVGAAGVQPNTIHTSMNHDEDVGVGAAVVHPGALSTFTSHAEYDYVTSRVHFHILFESRAAGEPPVANFFIVPYNHGW
jgi:hypothetical protein